MDYKERKVFINVVIDFEELLCLRVSFFLVRTGSELAKSWSQDQNTIFLGKNRLWASKILEPDPNMIFLGKNRIRASKILEPGPEYDFSW